MSYSRNVERTEIKVASLQSRLDEFKKAFESGAPPYNAPHEAIETMHRATAELKASGIEAHALKVGDRAPSFTLFNQDHLQVSLRRSSPPRTAGGQFLPRPLVTLLQHGTGSSTANLWGSQSIGSADRRAHS